MLGKLDPNKKQIVVVGAGLSGLLAAYQLSKHKVLRIDIYEASTRVGGLLKTEHTKFMLGERAANSFLVTPSILEICKELDVQMLSVNHVSRSRFIFRKGFPYKWPLTFWESFCFVLKIFKRRSRNSPNEQSSLSDWADFHFGKGARKYLLDPFCTGIYACTTNELCIGAVFPQLIPRVGQSFAAKLFELIKLKKEKAVMMTPKFGMEDLCQKIFAALNKQSNVHIHLSTPINSLDFVDFSKANLILATNSIAAARITAEMNPTLSTAISKITHASIVSVVVNVDKKFFEMASFVPNGVGILLCPGESQSLLGILFNSSSFEGRCKDGKSYTLTLMFKPEDVFDLQTSNSPQKAKLEDRIREAIQLVFKVKDVEIRDILVSVWNQTIPVYNLELFQFLMIADKYLPLGQVIVGSYTGKLGIRSFFEDAKHLNHQMTAIV